MHKFLRALRSLLAHYLIFNTWLTTRGCFGACLMGGQVVENSFVCKLLKYSSHFFVLHRLILFLIFPSSCTLLIYRYVEEAFEKLWIFFFRLCISRVFKKYFSCILFGLKILCINFFRHYNCFLKTKLLQLVFLTQIISYKFHTLTSFTNNYTKSLK